MSWNSMEKKNPPNPRKRFLQFTSTESETDGALDTSDALSADGHTHAVDSDDDEDNVGVSSKRMKSDAGDDDGGAIDQSERTSTAKGLSFLVEERRREQQEQLREEMTGHATKRHGLSESESDSSDSEPEVSMKPVSMKMEGVPAARIDEAIEENNMGARMLQRMGYKKGEGLGLKGQGRKDPIPLSGQRGTLGLGHRANKELGRDFDVRWDETRELVSEQETVAWIKCDQTPPNEATLRSWMEIGRKKLAIEDECEFCSQEKLTRMLQAKAVFDDLSDRELREARTRANPFETIGGAFFQNRAAMKTANLDAVFDWIFCQTKPDNVQKDMNTGRVKVNKDRDKPLFYFADVCAGPGGFTEYMLWRRAAFNAKGFGFTLKGKDDFKLDKFLAASPEFFEPYYGVDDDGDVTKPHNLLALEEFVKKSTDGLGIHLFMADGGFSVEGQENIQEILSKRLYLCQFLAALSMLRTNGNFVCKLFDLFTPFSVGLVYLMYLAFDRISLHKPHTSRPANSERYIIGEKMSERGGTLIKNYLTEINNKLNELAGSDMDVVSVVPLDTLKKDLEFFDYVVSSNESIADRQTLYLEKYKIFARNQGQIDSKQADLREKCMQYWQIPNVNKPFLMKQNRQSPDMTFGDICREIYQTNPVNSPADLFARKPADFSLQTIRQHGQGHVVALQMRLALTATRDHPAIILGLGRQSVFIWKKGNTRWERMDAGGHLVRLPRDTVLLGEVAEIFKGQGRGLQKSKRLRVFDAMMLAGDNVSDLPFGARMAAIKKFCKAINCVKTQPRFIEVEPAETWRLSDFSKERERLEALSIKGEKMIVMHGKDDPEYYLPCRAMRVVSMLNEPWYLCWSRSRKQEYAFHPKTDQKGFEESYLELQCCTTFRDALNQTAVWSWLQQASSSYGPNAILGSATESEDTLTLDSFFKAAQDTMPPP